MGPNQKYQRNIRWTQCDHSLAHKHRASKQVSHWPCVATNRDARNFPPSLLLHESTSAAIREWSCRHLGTRILKSAQSWMFHELAANGCWTCGPPRTCRWRCRLPISLPRRSSQSLMLSLKSTALPEDRKANSRSVWSAQCRRRVSHSVDRASSSIP